MRAVLKGWTFDSIFNLSLFLIEVINPAVIQGFSLGVGFLNLRVLFFSMMDLGFSVSRSAALSASKLSYTSVQLSNLISLTNFSVFISTNGVR